MLDDDAPYWEDIAVACFELNTPYCDGGLIEQPSDVVDVLRLLKRLRGHSLSEAFDGV